MSPTLDELATQARAEDGRALESFVERIADDVYRLALRMLADPRDAEDAAQEILVKVATGLAGFRGESGVRTWVWRIAVNHVLSFRRSQREEATTFEDFERMLESGLAASSALAEEPGDELLEEEVKLGCTHSMLLCLDRDHRAAFALGDVFGLSGDEGAEVLGIEPAAFRKRLSRARRRMREFMERNCGLVSEDAACRCRRQVRPSVLAGVIDPERPVYTVHPVRARSEPGLVEAYDALAAGERYVAILRDQPDYAAPETLRGAVRRILDRTGP